MDFQGSTESKWLGPNIRRLSNESDLDTTIFTLQAYEPSFTLKTVDRLR